MFFCWFTSPTRKGSALWAATFERKVPDCDWCRQHGYCWPPRHSPLVAGDSKPRQGHHVLCGVGRSLPTTWPFSTATFVCSPLLATIVRELKEGCLDCGIDIDASITVPALPLTYLFIMDEHGEMQETINDMQIYVTLSASRSA